MTTLVFAAQPLLAAQPPTASTPADALSSHLGWSLRQLIAWHHAQPRNQPVEQRRAQLARQFPGSARHIQTNTDATRAVMEVTLDGAATLPSVRAAFLGLGADILAENDLGKAGSVLSVRLPLAAAEGAVQVRGVAAISLAPKAWRHVGKVTTAGANILGEAGVNPPYDGKGMTIGVISDSYDAATVDPYGKPITVHAAQDIASGDLPGPGNPLGHTTPVFVLADGDPANTANADEGRAMLQIVHDMAPGASLAFTTDGGTPESLAANLRNLRTNKSSPCDVIVDDITFPQEPMFYDGTVAQAVTAVTRNATLPGHNVLYYSAAGNEGDLGYVATFNAISDADARAGASRGNLKLEQVPRSLTAGGFHNFDPRAGKITIAQRVKVQNGVAEVDMQWDDPPSAGEAGVTDYDLLVFDAAGNYLPSLSGRDNNVAMGNALELIDLPPAADGGAVNYQLAIARVNKPATPATHLRYVVETYGTFTAKFTSHDTPTIFGHSVAPGADAVAAYYAGDTTTNPERFSSLGPATIYFDANGNRLDVPEVRQQPTLAGVDGVNNTFFPPGPLNQNDTDGDRFPNFFGTSAAAPHVAAGAAQLLQAAGGPGSLSDVQVRSLLQRGALTHQPDPNLTENTATGLGGTASVTFQEVRDDLDPAGIKKFFRVSFTGPVNAHIAKLSVFAVGDGMVFDPDPASPTGAPFAIGATAGGLQKADVTVDPLGSTYAFPASETRKNKLTLRFAPGSFVPGGTLSFGIGINRLADAEGLDPLQWAMLNTEFNARVVGPTGKDKLSGAVGEVFTTDYSPSVGAGRIDLHKTIADFQKNGAAVPTDSRMALTSGNLLLSTNDGRVVEVTRHGRVVQQFLTSETPKLPGIVIHTESTVLANGDVAILNGEDTPMLTILNPAQGTKKDVTYPGWRLDYGTRIFGNTAGQSKIASVGNYVFVPNDNLGEDNAGSGSLLRYDVTADRWQSFGVLQLPAGESNYFGSLIAGKDGRLRAIAYSASSMFAGINQIYEPTSLALAGYFPQPLGYAVAALDASGNFYAQDSNSMLIKKLSPEGALLGSLDYNAVPPLSYGINSIQVSTDGAVFAAAGDQLIVTDTALKTPVKFEVLPDKGGLKPNFTVALIGP